VTKVSSGIRRTSKIKIIDTLFPVNSEVWYGVLSYSVFSCWATRAATARSLAGLRNWVVEVDNCICDRVNSGPRGVSYSLIDICGGGGIFLFLWLSQNIQNIMWLRKYFVFS
jgi:hypothetical protein